MNLGERVASVRIRGRVSFAFRALTPEVHFEIVQRILASGAGIAVDPTRNVFGRNAYLNVHGKYLTVLPVCTRAVCDFLYRSQEQNACVLLVTEKPSRLVMPVVIADGAVCGGKKSLRAANSFGRSARRYLGVFGCAAT